MEKRYTPEIAKAVHISHCGIEKTKANVRTTVFCPGMTKNIEVMVSSRENLSTYANLRNSTIALANSCIGCVRTQKSQVPCMWSLIIIQSKLKPFGSMAKLAVMLSGV